MQAHTYNNTATQQLQHTTNLKNLGDRLQNTYNNTVTQQLKHITKWVSPEHALDHITALLVQICPAAGKSTAFLPNVLIPSNIECKVVFLTNVES